MSRLIIWELLCLALLWTSFCRAVRMDQTTRLDVRVALLSLGMAALFCIGSPLYGWVPDTVTMVLMAAVTLVQVTTASLWRDGTPRPFTNCPHLPLGRRCGDWP